MMRQKKRQPTARLMGRLALILALFALAGTCFWQPRAIWVGIKTVAIEEVNRHDSEALR